MKVKKTLYKCGVCGVENEYLVYMSNFINGYSDFDMKPVGSMMSIGANIMECPNCHYANYRIYNTIESRLANNLELWNKSKDFQEIIKNYSGSLRKILLVAKQYENNADYFNAYKSYIMASWVVDDKKASDFRVKACQLFTDKILPNYTNNLLQIADILRMEEEFKKSTKIVDSVKGLVDEKDKKLLKIIKKETDFIKKNDSKRHNLGEIFK